jgi:hypothetical protein
LAETGFSCVDLETGASTNEAFCDFGPLYTVSKTFKQIPDENFNITYGDGEFLNGIMGTEKVTLADVEVTQEVALINFAAWDGDGITSGLVGLAYGAMYVPQFPSQRERVNTCSEQVPTQAQTR